MKEMKILGKKIDLTGQRFGKITVLSESPERKNKKIYWLCKCDCGVEKLISGSDLRSGKTVSCGCNKTEKIKSNLLGKKFGRLTVIEETGERKNRQVIWKCLCDCGNIIFVRANNLKQGLTTSCGCYKREITKQVSKINLVGKHFGLLTVIEETPQRKNNSIVWKCQCECGKIVNVSSDYLMRGYRLSCGCLKESLGVRKIKQILLENNIPFICEKTFDSCIFPETNAKLRFDFYINNQYLLEFDGKQHFQYSNGEKTWNTKEHYERLQKRDSFKNEWCEQNNIILIRIPYNVIDVLKLEDLLPNKTKYRVV